MLIKIRYPNYVSVLISFVFYSWIVNEFEIDMSNTNHYSPRLRISKLGSRSLRSIYAIIAYIYILLSLRYS